MSDQEVTYSTVRFHKSSSELQSRLSPDETQGPREAGHKGCSVPWHLISILLGILCSILLVTVTVLVTHIFQHSHEKHEQQKTLNFCPENLTMQNDLREEVLRNKSVEYDARTRQKELNSLSQKRHRCCGEAKIVLDCLPHTGNHVEGQRLCCGIKCYYFIMDNKHWNGCKQTCQDCRLSLLMMDDDEELMFLKLQLSTNRYWIGLKYDAVKGKWQWTLNGPTKLDLMAVKSLQQTRGCAFLSYKGIGNDDCARPKSCICEGRVDKFPGSVSTGNIRT